MDPAVLGEAGMTEKRCARCGWPPEAHVEVIRSQLLERFVHDPNSRLLPCWKFVLPKEGA